MPTFGAAIFTGLSPFLLKTAQYLGLGSFVLGRSILHGSFRTVMFHTYTYTGTFDTGTLYTWTLCGWIFGIKES
jgi:hypothetical protein